MRNLTKIALALLVALMAASTAYAVDSDNFDVTAEVESNISLEVVLREDSSTGTIVTEMDLGPLAEIVADSNLLRSQKSIVAMVTPNAQSQQYTITQTGTQLTGPTASIDSGASTFVPVYAAADNGGATDPGTLGSAQSWVGTDLTVYNSDAAGSRRTIQVHYSITDDPAAGATGAVPIDQKAEVYQANVQFSLTTL